jgi:mRNA interferase MazF
VTRGDIYRVRLPSRGGHEQHGPRYAVLVQADELLGLSTVLVAPTSQSVRPASFRPEVDIAGQRTRVMVEQLRALDVRRLDDFEGRLGVDELREVDEALSLVFALFA